MRVTQATKDAFLDTNITKHLYVKVIVNGTEHEVDPELIIGDSMILNESIMPNGDLTFGGGIPSSFEIELFSKPNYFNYVDINNYAIKIEASIQAGDTEIVPLFKGYINEMTVNPNNLRVKIKAYDSLYSTLVNCNGDDVTNNDFIGFWGRQKYEEESYKQRYGTPNVAEDIISYFVQKGTKMSMSELIENWDNVLEYFADLRAKDYCDVDKLPTKEQNGNVVPLGWTLDPDDPNKDGLTNFIASLNESDMCAMEVIKQLCQFNNTFLINNRNGYNYRIVGCSFNGNNMKKAYNYTTVDNSSLGFENIPYYKTVSYTSTSPIGSSSVYSLIRKNSEGKKIGILSNQFRYDGDVDEEGWRDIPYDRNMSYECSGNMFVDQPVFCPNLVKAGANVKSVVPFMSVVNYSITTSGRPWLECGQDFISFSIRTGELIDHETPFMNLCGVLCTRTLKGIQNLEDTYSFSSALTPDWYDTKGSIGSRLNTLELTRPKTQYVTEVPESFDTNTIYFVRKS